MPGSVGGAGSKKAPLEFDLKQKIAGEIPAFPGKDPPERCTSTGDCPPGMPYQGIQGVSMTLSYDTVAEGFVLVATIAAWNWETAWPP